MVPMRCMRLSSTDRRELLALARESIERALELGACALYPQRQHSLVQQEHRASFVTLRLKGELRGCCGSMDATRPLAEDVWRNAWTSAFRDPRFAPLTAAECADTHLHVSVLHPLEQLPALQEEALLAQLRPDIDGLVLELGAARATFLPSVWAQFPDPRAFVRHLKLKAGWSAEFWSPQMRAWRYLTEGFGDGEM